jgi:thioredoxin 1
VWTPAGQPYAEKFKVVGIPTQVFLDADGREFFRHTGFFPLEQILPVLKKQGVKVD